MSDHYTHMEIEPIEFIMANNLDFCQGNVIKYVCRYRSKGGIEDLRKAQTYLDYMMEEYEQADWEAFEVEYMEPEEALEESIKANQERGLYQPDIYPEDYQTCHDEGDTAFAEEDDLKVGMTCSDDDEEDNSIRAEVRKIAMKAIYEGLPIEYEWFACNSTSGDVGADVYACKQQPVYGVDIWREPYYHKVGTLPWFAGREQARTFPVHIPRKGA